ncbi:FtsX-like permease family protein [Cryptosporangium phraense]|uniref:FtsX-like permease family protein n=1 Tax=Cryptosporangium phraense TaxID=2593070 RepID=A0A545AVE5_9ACTN|nr:FtsX-like permease family protein [Cryptosporangium phraense]TQS45308.1 FtsX-like permease family protein [Cryptosporangium phraense]
MNRLWLAGLVRRQPWRLVGPALGVALAVSLLASLGAFISSAKATMTSRAVSSIAVDWQVQVTGDASASTAAGLVAREPGVRHTEVVGFTQVPGLSTTIDGSTQTTGSGVVLGLPSTYRTAFPDQLRVLTGASEGVLLAQQTASNLHAGPGSRVAIARDGAAPLLVTVAGIVDFPQANSLFQTVGAPAGAQPTAPPDNVVVLPSALYRTFAAPVQRTRPDLVTVQIHAARTHRLPADPAAAYTASTAAARRLEVRGAGSVLVGDNLAAALDAARSDSGYAQILFVFLGLPGAVLATLLTAAVAHAGAGRRRREQALLRIRGVSQPELLRLVTLESVVVGLFGCGVGTAVALVAGATVFSVGIDLPWIAAAVGTGVLITAGTLLRPARRDVGRHTVHQANTVVPVGVRLPPWARYGLDAVALLGAVLVFTAAGHNNYQLVLAPEGVPTIVVSYWALAAPALLWLGGGLVIWRLADLVLGRGRRLVAWLLRPLAAGAAPLLAAGIGRQRRPLVAAVVLLAMSLAFAISTAGFNATYRAQAEADALLTNGADVTVAESPGTTVGPGYAQSLARIHGVRAVEPVQHRYAYVGTDLQDLYGVQPSTIRSVTALQDAYFLAGGTAASLMRMLAAEPDSVLVSSETVKDYQLRLGDRINLRLVDGRTHGQVTVPFHYVGIVAEFPTAPKDSFLVANASYVAQRTGSDAVGTFLIDAGNGESTAVASRVREAVGPLAAVTDIATVRGHIGSSLTSVDLSGLTRIELAYALILAAASAGLVLALGLNERRRSLAIMSAVGAQRRHVSAAVVGESGVLAIAGLGFGALLGGLLTQLLVSILAGVFDPPPSVITVPWAYLGGLAAIVLACVAVVTAGAIRVAGRRGVGALRDLA